MSQKSDFNINYPLLKIKKIMTICGSYVGSDSNPKILDLSTVSLTAVSGSLAVKLEDISLAVYQILPHNLSVMVEARVQRLKEKRNLSNNGLNKKSKK